MRAPRDGVPNGRRSVLVFMLTGLGAVLVIGVLGYGVLRQVAIDEAVRDARDLTDAEARALAPLLTGRVVASEPAAIARLDEAVRGRVLSSRVVRVKVWTQDGLIVYSDDVALRGQRFTLGDDEAEALRSRSVHAELSDLERPENRDERQYGRLLEVYVGLQATSGDPVLFEVYQRFDDVTASGHAILRSFAPALLGGLVALWLVQLPIALALSRRVESGHRRQKDLLVRAIESSEQERRRVAADLHDSVVQGLAGSSMSLSALAADARRAGALQVADGIDEHAAELRQWVRELRTLVVSIAPPRLHDQGLPAALVDLASTIDARGIQLDVDVPDDVRLGRTEEALVFRGAQEALRNVIDHAHASRVRMVLDGESPVRLLVADDGVGFDQGTLESRSRDGHVGLRLLGELARDVGGRLDVESRPGLGTTLLLEVPAR